MLVVPYSSKHLYREIIIKTFELNLKNYWNCNEIFRKIIDTLRAEYFFLKNINVFIGKP
jgi:hypothetical protein